MPKERIDRAPKLKAIFNVETNFLPNIDYEHCQARGIYVLSPTSSFAQAVAESSLAMAIDLARGITAADRAFRAGGEAYGLEANEGCFMFAGAPVGIIGFGDLGRTLRALLAPFRNPVTVYDPWLPPDVIRAHDCTPAALDEVLSTSRIIFVFASVTTENQGFLGQRELDLIQPGCGIPADEPRRRGRFPGARAPGRKRTHQGRDRRVPRGAGAGRPSRAQARGRGPALRTAPAACRKRCSRSGA